MLQPRKYYYLKLTVELDMSLHPSDMSVIYFELSGPQVNG